MDLREHIDYFRQHRFVRGVVFLQITSALGSFAQALFGIFIARILQPELYGMYAVAFSLAALIFITTGVQETITVVLGQTYAEKNREHTVDALAFFLKFTIFFSIVTLIAALFLPKIGSIFYHDARVGVYAAIVVVASIISSFTFSMVSMILQVSGNIKRMALLGLADQVLRAVLAVLAVAAGYGILGAAVGHLVGAAIICVVSIIIWQSTVRAYPIFPSWRELWQRSKIAKRSKHLSLSIWVAVDKNVGALYTILPVLLAGIYLSRADVAYFKLAFGLVMLALSLLGPISTLLNSEFSRMKIDNPRNVVKNFIKVTAYAVAISTALTLVTILAAPFVFKILYGPSFLPSVKYISELLVFGVLFGLGVGLGPMWRVVNRVNVSIAINLVVLGIGIPLGLYLVKHFGVSGGILMVTLWFTVSHATSFIYLVTQGERLLQK